MDCDIFSQSLGYIGKTTYTLKYLENTYDFSYKWPINSVLNRNSCESVLESILSQNVGIDRSFAYRETCDPLKPILIQLLKYHSKTNYRELLRKCKKKIKVNSQPSTPRRVIKEYIHRIIFNIVPLHLFGTNNNAVQFERNFRKIFFLGKFQVFSLNMVLRRMRVKSLAYLRHIDGHYNKTNLFAKLFIWLIRMYILPALKCVFYVSESNHSNKYVFYEKHVWKKIQRRHMKKIKKQVLGFHKNCLVSGIVQSKHLYTVKLLPKRRGCRPIFVKLEIDDYWKMKRNLAQKTAEVLLARVAQKYFTSVHTSWNVFHQKWLYLHDKWLSSCQRAVYFVRTDFIDAFARINLAKLMEIISKIREENTNLSDLCFSFQGWLKNVPLNSAFKILENYGNNFVFKHQEKVYRLTEGLCQGGPLSSLLYNLYLGVWEEMYLSEYVGDEMGFFIRNCDDCLYVTMDHAKASSYLRRLEEGFPDFNLQVNLQKTENNIRDESKITVSFSNYMLDVKSLQIYGCYEFYRNSSIFHSSRLSSVESPGKIVSKRIGRPCMCKLVKVFLDSTYNTVHTILYNVFMAANLSATKGLVFMERFFTHLNERFIMTCFVTCARRIAKVVLNSLERDVNINQIMLKWMVIKAFQVRLEAANLKIVKNILPHIYNYLKNLFDQLDEKQKESISAFFHVQQHKWLKLLY